MLKFFGSGNKVNVLFTRFDQRSCRRKKNHRLSLNTHVKAGSLRSHYSNHEETLHLVTEFPGRLELIFHHSVLDVRNMQMH